MQALDQHQMPHLAARDAGAVAEVARQKDQQSQDSRDLEEPESVDDLPDFREAPGRLDREQAARAQVAREPSGRANPAEAVRRVLSSPRVLAMAPLQEPL